MKSIPNETVQKLRQLAAAHPVTILMVQQPPPPPGARRAGHVRPEHSSDLVFVDYVTRIEP